MNSIDEGKLLFIISHYTEIVVKKIEPIKNELLFEEELIEIYNDLYRCVNSNILYPFSFYSNLSSKLSYMYKKSNSQINLSRIIKIILSLYNR
jgi:hypothetical protein